MFKDGILEYESSIRTYIYIYIYIYIYNSTTNYGKIARQFFLQQFTVKLCWKYSGPLGRPEKLDKTEISCISFGFLGFQNLEFCI